MHKLPISQTISAPPPMCVVKWLLRHGSAAIACEVDMNADRSFDVRVTPSSPSNKPFVEHFGDAVHAMERHAAIAGLLRDDGWRVAERVTSPVHLAS